MTAIERRIVCVCAVKKTRITHHPYYNPARTHNQRTMGATESRKMPLDVTLAHTAWKNMSVTMQSRVRALVTHDAIWGRLVAYTPDAHYILAMHEDILVGYISLITTDTIRKQYPQTDAEFESRGGVLESDPGLTIGMLYVSDAHRGKGVMTALLGEVMKYMEDPANKYPYITFMTSVHNTIIQRKARKMGFVPMPEPITLGGGKAYVYRRTLHTGQTNVVW